MRVRWEVEDGYAGGSRPQSIEIDDEDWLACEDDDERDGLIEECIADAFEQRITWFVKGIEGMPESDEYQGAFKRCVGR